MVFKKKPLLCVLILVINMMFLEKSAYLCNRLIYR